MTAIETDGGGSSEQELPRKKLSGKKIVLFIVLPLLLIGGGAAAVIFSGILDNLFGKAEEEPVETQVPAQVCGQGAPLFFELPDVLVNLNTGDRRPEFLKLKIVLDICKPEDQPVLTQVMPRITDTFQVYLRELRKDDLKGSAGVYRLREELLMRVNAITYPIQVRDVLINEILVQ